MENLGDDDFESHYGSDNFEDAASGDDQSTSRNGAAKRKKYHRHTTFQIQELEASFKDNPHPDEKARLELGKRLSLLPRQVKFWFQNRRTQVKTQVGRHENSLLKQENDKLRMENIAMKEAMANPTCNNCGGPAILGEIPLEEQQLMIENARLKDELDRLNTLALGRANGLVLTPTVRNSSLDLSVGRNGFMDSTSFSFPMGLEFGGHGHQLSSVFSGMNSVVGSPSPFDNKSLFLELALSAMEELVKLAQVDSPLWCASFKGIGEMLNIEEYSKLFSSCCIGSKPNHFVSQGTRAAATVMIESGALVENLMDSDQWTKMFPWTIGKASTVHVVSRGVGGKNGALQLMQAEFQVLSPMVPVRQVKFVRFVKKHSENIWAIVDVSADAISPSLNKNTAMICRRLPSGCILQDLGNGFSKVTWIEHMEYDESIVHHLYRPVISSGIAFGAQKWVANLQRQCELLPVIMSTPITGDDSELGPNGRKCVAELAQRMTRIFCTGVCATTHNWEVIQIGEDSKLIFRKTTGTSGEPNGIILSATMTVWVPVSPQRLLEFLTDVKCRVHWDILSQDGPMHQTLQIPKSHDPGNHISLLSTSVVNPSAYQSNVLILQDATTDASGSVIVHAAVDTGAMKLVLKGEDSSSVTVLPSGFAVVPDCYKDLSRPENGGEGSSSGTITGSMLTAGFQILASSQPAGTKVNMESVDTIKSLIVRTVDGIKNGLQINSDG